MLSHTTHEDPKLFTVVKACIQKHLCIAFNKGECDEETDHALSPMGKTVRHRCAKCLKAHPIIECDKISFDELRFGGK